MAVLALGVLGGSGSFADDEPTVFVQVLLSGREATYCDAWEGIAECLHGHGWKVTSTIVGDRIEEDETPPADSPDAYLAVGPDALTWVSEHGIASVTLFHCLVSPARVEELDEDRRPLGVSTAVPLVEQFRLIREALPEARVVGVLYDEHDASIVDSARRALPDDMRLESRSVGEPKELARAMHALLEAEVDLLWIPPDFELYTSATVRSLILAALRQKTPVFGFSESVVKAGALLGVDIDARVHGQQAAELLRRHLQRSADVSKPEAQGGPDPAAEFETIPSEGEGSPGRAPSAVAAGAEARSSEPPRYQVVVNLFAARQLGVTLPAGILARADRVLRTEE